MRRQELLEAVVAELERGGIGDRSLRDIAAAVGTSHRMLIHHFGSRDGLFTDVVRTVEEDQRRFLATLDESPGDRSRVMWLRLSDPRLWPAERLFFECYARACRGEAPYASLLPGLVDDWLDRVTVLDPDATVGAAEARAQARLGLALFRGLLLDLVGTGDRAGVDAAFEQFRALEAVATGRAASRPAGDLPDVPRRTADTPTNDVRRIKSRKQAHST
jgi:AcrR family transcriptional regulator